MGRYGTNFSRKLAIQTPDKGGGFNESMQHHLKDLSI
jgi:hypothetical protein